MILIADNLHALNPIVAEAMKRLDPKPLQDIALRCLKAGAEALDLNPGYLAPRHEDRMAFLVEAVQEVTSVPLILDSPFARVLARGLSECRETPILNALSLEEKKLQEILPLAVEHRTRLVLLLMDEKSFVPPTMEEKLALAVTLRELALQGGVRHEDLIFDPVLPNLSWHDGWAQAGEVVKTVRMLSGGGIFPEPVRTMVGLSNLRSGVKRIHPMETETLCLAALGGAGLDLVLANALDEGLMADLRTIRRFCTGDQE